MRYEQEMYFEVLSYLMPPHLPVLRFREQMLALQPFRYGIISTEIYVRVIFSLFLFNFLMRFYHSGLNQLIGVKDSLSPGL
jgi:hypothetical protein